MYYPGVEDFVVSHLKRYNTCAAYVCLNVFAQESGSYRMIFNEARFDILDGRVNMITTENGFSYVHSNFPIAPNNFSSFTRQGICWEMIDCIRTGKNSSYNFYRLRSSHFYRAPIEQRVVTKEHFKHMCDYLLTSVSCLSANTF